MRSLARRILSNDGVGEHVPAQAADFLVAAQQPLSLIADSFGHLDRSGVPWLDVQLDPVQGRDGPGKARQRGQGCGGDAAAAGA